MAWTSADIPDQRGRVAVVTGANGGLGLETARRLAARGAHVVMAARDQHKARKALVDITAAHPGASLEIVAIDLGSQDSVHRAAETITRRHRIVDLLINNAGVMAGQQGTTADGHERQLGIDHLGHWTLTGLLLPSLTRAPRARVVTVTSIARHLGSPVDPEDPHLADTYDPWRAYGRAKLANWHFGIGLHRLCRGVGAPVTSLLAHPGAARTDLTATTVAASNNGRAARLLAVLTDTLGHSAADGALPQLRAATDPAARGGRLYAPRFVGRGAPTAVPGPYRPGTDSAIRTLWDLSWRETGVRIDAHTLRSHQR